MKEFQAPLVPGAILFETKSVDLGETFQHHQYEVRFPFTVVGEDAVRVKELNTGVGFTLAYLEPPLLLGDWIHPGTQGAVVVTFDAGRYKADKTSTVLVRGDFESEREQLSAEAFVIPVFELEPRVLQFGDIILGDAYSQKRSLVVQITALKEFQVLCWKRTPPGVSIEAIEGVEILEDGRAVQSFRVTAGPEIAEGRMSTSFIGETDLGTEIEFMVNANVLGMVKYAPSSRVAFGIFDQGKEKKRSIRIESVRGAVDVPLPTLTIEGEAAKVMQAEVRTVTSGLHHRITLNIGKHAPSGSYNGVLRITYPEASGLAPKEIMLNARIRSSR
ncbi:MAG: hypothetical protein COA70_13620 [Planctomycetota bacterium]|nr:MAG: hypothetical protein COA70_13620 [Planctomycetota bacterium]